MILPSFLSARTGLTHLSERLVAFTPDLLRKSTPEGSVYNFRGVRATEVYVNGYCNAKLAKDTKEFQYLTCVFLAL